MQRSLAGYSPWGWKESNMTEQLSTHSLTVPTLNKAYCLLWSPMN